MPTLKKIWSIVSTVLVILAVLCAVFLMGSRLLGYRVYTVISGSMEPKYMVGDLLYVKPVDPSTIQVDDDISFVLNENLVVATHRVVRIDAEKQHIYTKGLANEIEDSDATVINGKSLVDVLKVAVVDADDLGSRESAIAAGNEAGWSNLVSFDLPSTLEVGQEESYGIVIYWEPTDHDNDYNLKNEVLKVSLAVHLVATQMTAESDSYDEYYDGSLAWLGYADTAWYNTTDVEFTIASAEELAGLAKLVNEEVDTFAGKTILLASDIDLDNRAWTAISGFSGTFDGKNHTIHNLYINDTAAWGQGLFGYMDAHATVKNVTVNNANVTAEDTCGVIVGYVFGTADFVNVHVTGDVHVTGNEQVGGIAGHAGYATFTDCSVVANAGSSVTATAGSFAAGIAGYHREKANTVAGCSVENLTITGKGAVGGLVGIAGYGNVITDCSVKNVTLNKTGVGTNPSVGAFIGCWGYNANSPITLTNNTAENVQLNAGYSVDYAAYNMMYGSEYNGKTNTNFILENNTLTNVDVVNVAVLAAKPSNVQDVINNAPAGSIIALTAGEYHTTIVAKSGITLLGSEGAVVDCINLNGASNVTLKGISFDAAGAQNAYYSASKVQAIANIIGSTPNSDNGARNVVIDGCTFTGEFGATTAPFRVSIAFVDYGRKGGFSDNVSIKNCTFDTVGANFDIYGYYCGNGGEFVIENNTFVSNAKSVSVLLNRYASSVPVVLKGNTFVTKANLDSAFGLADHSSYGVSVNASGNTFAN